MIKGATQTGKPTQFGNTRAERKVDQPEIKTHGKKNSRRSKNPSKRPIEETTQRQPELPVDPDKREQSSDIQQTHQSEYVRTFERLFRSFRQRVFESFGERCEEVIARAEQKVRFLSPEFDCHMLTEKTAPVILDLIEEIVKGASFFKRSKLRQAAITLISDLYNRQYDLLEKYRAIDQVEQAYYRFKK